MIRSSKQPSFIWLWWRRKLFYVRRIPFTWILILFICILSFIIIIFKIFSSGHVQHFIEHDVQWNSINETLKVKEKVFDKDFLLNQFKIIKNGTEKISSTKPILILLYTTIFLSKKYCTSTADRIFGQSCPSKDRCQWTCNPRRLDQADAIIFHAYDIQYYHAKVPKRTETKPNSIWILWSDEPPSMVDYNLFNSYQFNWTISYKLNSEVSIGSYGLLSKRNSLWSDTDYNNWVKKQFYHRLNGAVWFVSNCDAKKRLEYYYELRRQKNLIIEGYGRCVDYYPIHFCKVGSQCEYDYMLKYKFYLSFESTTCRDYITEKFFKSFYYGLIPIVYGPERKDYNHLAPPNSFIHINDFNNDMNKLVNYLEDIYSNYTLYSMYHEWRKKYEVIINGKSLERIRMCELCERLNKINQDDITYYKNIDEFFHEKC